LICPVEIVKIFKIIWDFYKGEIYFKEENSIMAGNITEETLLGDILKRPYGAKILSKFKLPCLHCPMAALEMGVLKIGDVSHMYGVDLENLLKELNAEEEKQTQE
jgi:hypothetical protein